MTEPRGESPIEPAEGSDDIPPPTPGSPTKSRPGGEPDGAAHDEDAQENGS